MVSKLRATSQLLLLNKYLLVILFLFSALVCSVLHNTHPMLSYRITLSYVFIECT